jgi:hypothetical protein
MSKKAKPEESAKVTVVETPPQPDINPALLEKCEYGVERGVATQHNFCATCEQLIIVSADQFRLCGFWRNKAKVKR